MKTQEQNSKGLHQRYIVSKTSGKPVDERAEYFVLRLDWGGDDHRHIEACRKAVLKYAEEIKEHLPDLKRNGLEAVNFQYKMNYNRSTNFKYTT